MNIIMAVAFIGQILMPADTPVCGAHVSAESVLMSRVPLLFSDAPGMEEIRAEVGLADLPAGTAGYVVTDEMVCHPLVDYFASHMESLADSAWLNQHGWDHAVLSYGPYHMLLVTPRNPDNVVGGRRSQLYVFDQSGYVGSVMP